MSGIRIMSSLRGLIWSFLVGLSGVMLLALPSSARVEEGWLDFKLDKYLSFSSTDPAVKIEDLRFEKDDVFGIRATVNIKNLTEERAAISFHIALFDADRRLVSIGGYNSVAPPAGGFKPREAYHATIQMYVPKDMVEKVRYFQARAFRRR